ncbi:Trehalose/maltose import ATP-binding protein MalK [Candidatus Tiddalikarchaeum anstoanum]|nr:Trehalose/maltose import ATP-binding protein MalK [Candidatus Tiddalikarchaeum anstoanum]
MEFNKGDIILSEVIELKGVTKKFGKLVAVNNVSLSIRKGEFFGLLGPNGSGKTTTIKILTGQIKPNSGHVKVLGVDVLRNPVGVREVVGIIPEQETPPSFLTAEEYLHLVCKIRVLKDIGEKCDYWFKFLEFEDSRNVLCKDLSRGTRQKLMFAQAFIHSPNIAFIDEPLINLDPVIQKKVKDYLLDYVKKGNTIFFSTHILEVAQELCTKVGIIHNGRIIYEGPVKKNVSLEKIFLEKVGKDNHV